MAQPPSSGVSGLAERLAQDIQDRARLLKENVTEHHAIRLAIEEGDGAGARLLMLQHVKHSGELVALRARVAQPIPPLSQHDGGAK